MERDMADRERGLVPSRAVAGNRTDHGVRRMSNGADAPSRADVAGELSAWAVGGGVLTAALFPLAIPILALTAVAALPLVAVALVAGLAAALLMLPVLAVRGLIRRVSAARRAASPARQQASAHQAPSQALGISR
jgi:hypothetical protein